MLLAREEATRAGASPLQQLWKWTGKQLSEVLVLKVRQFSKRPP
jgi:hypothetical protein